METSKYLLLPPAVVDFSKLKLQNLDIFGHHLDMHLYFYLWTHTSLKIASSTPFTAHITLTIMTGLDTESRLVPITGIGNPPLQQKYSWNIVVLSALLSWVDGDMWIAHQKPSLTRLPHHHCSLIKSSKNMFKVIGFWSFETKNIRYPYYLWQCCRVSVVYTCDQVSWQIREVSCGAAVVKLIPLHHKQSALYIQKWLLEVGENL